MVVFLACLFSELQLKSIAGSGSISDNLVSISTITNRMRVSNLVALINNLAIIVLGVLFYITLSRQNKTPALIARGCFLAEGITLAVTKIEYALISLSQQFVALGDFLYNGIDRRGYDIHILFFCAGGML